MCLCLFNVLGFRGLGTAFPTSADGTTYPSFEFFILSFFVCFHFRHSPKKLYQEGRKKKKLLCVKSFRFLRNSERVVCAPACVCECVRVRKVLWNGHDFSSPSRWDKVFCVTVANNQLWLDIRCACDFYGVSIDRDSRTIIFSIWSWVEDIISN